MLGRILLLAAIFAGSLLLLRGGIVRADVFQLASGGQIDGQLVNVDRQARDNYVVRTADGLQLTFTAAAIKRFVPQTKAEADYERFLKKMPASAEGNWTMAQWCSDNGLNNLRDVHLNEVLAHDPEHKKARLALGYTSLDGKWVKTEDWNRQQGYIYYRGAWRTPQDAAAMDAAEKLALAQRQFKPKLKAARSRLEGRDQAAALAEIRATTDPLAAAALVEMYEDEKSPSFRQLWIEVLAMNFAGAASDALVQAAMEGSEREREAARDALAQRNDGRAVGALLAELKSKDNIRVNRAGAALGRIKDPETFLPLVDALVTEHKYMITRGPVGSTSATFGSGGTSFSPGGSAKVVKQKQKNASVRDALMAITGQPLQYDKEEWLAWHAQQNAPPDDVNFRRDP
jgi:hypothetical protein